MPPRRGWWEDEDEDEAEGPSSALASLACWGERPALLREARRAPSGTKAAAGAAEVPVPVPVAVAVAVAAARASRVEAAVRWRLRAGREAREGGAGSEGGELRGPMAGENLEPWSGLGMGIGMGPGRCLAL